VLEGDHHRYRSSTIKPPQVEAAAGPGLVGRDVFALVGIAFCGRTDTDIQMMLCEMLSDRPVPNNAARGRTFLWGQEPLEQEQRIGQDPCGQPY
jgi:hypothetical protein